MAFTEVTSESWFSRIGKSLIGILFGIGLFFVAVFVLWWNEGNSVNTAEGLKEAEKLTIDLPAPKVDPANDQKPVHLTGMTEISETLDDSEFGVEAKAIQLKRKVEMYQWKENSKTETKNKLGGGTESVTTYSHSKTWAEGLIDSSSFHGSDHPNNPATMPVQSQSWTAESVTVGEFNLSSGLISEMDKFQQIDPPVPAPAGYTPQGKILYKSANPSSPQIGDLRVTFEAAMPAEVSIIAAQNGDNLGPYTTSKKTEVEMLKYGSQTALAMFADAQNTNTIVTWLFRAGGLIALIVACSLILGPIGVIADVIPFLGGIARFGTFLLSLVIAIPVAFITIALAWVAARPVLAIALIVVAVIVPVALIMMRKKKPLPVTEPRVA